MELKFKIESTSFTMAFWIKTFDSNFKIFHSDSHSGCGGYNFQYSGSNILALRTENFYYSCVNAFKSIPASIHNNQFKHIVIVGKNKSFEVYVNGVCMGSEYLGGYGAVYAHKILLFRSFSCDIDELRFYNRALSPGDVIDLYNFSPPGCKDRILNGDETGVVCGGTCEMCGTCSDGIQYQGETGIDCGGPNCDPCPSCDDDIMNGDEEGIDCGGTECIDCPTCDDGIKNQGEEAIDCGGSNCAPCTTWNKNIENVFFDLSDVGIGSYSPDYKLDILGTVKARELWATTDGWPDFVFYNNYKLKSIKELEEYIEHYGKLPGVPSAKVIAYEGAEQIFMTTVLLRKIEELTLYLIAEEKRFEKVYKKNDIIVKLLAELETQSTKSKK